MGLDKENSMSKKYKPFNKEHWSENYLQETASTIIETCNRELHSMDGTCLSSKDKEEIRQIYKKYPVLLALIAEAYESKGYDSF